MAASFPASFKVFVRNQNRIDIVEADDVNELNDEMTAVQQTLGLNPHTSALFPLVTTVAQRFISIEGLFNGAGGTLPQSKVEGLSTTLTGLTNAYTSAISGEATTRAAADSSLNTAILNETSARISTDDALSSAITNEFSARQAADLTLQANINAEVAARAGNYVDLSGQIALERDRIDQLYARSRAIEGMVTRSTTAAYNSSALYQDFSYNATASHINDYTGRYPYISGKFYTDDPGETSVWAFSVSITWTGSGGSSGVGQRGIRLITAGGTILSQVELQANQDTGDDQMTLTWVGRLSGSLNYFVKVQVFQNSGGPLSVRANAGSTPTQMVWVKMPSGSAAFAAD